MPRVRPDGLDVRVLVVDNASTDGTRALVEESAHAVCAGGFSTSSSATPGKPHALNAGIAATDGDLIGLIDDDEEVDAGWFESIQRHFAAGREHVDFIGGKCLPLWGAPRPGWLGRGYLGVIGWVDPGPLPRAMDASYPGILMGGNAVIRRRVSGARRSVLDRAQPNRRDAARVRGRGHVPSAPRARRSRPVRARPRHLPSRARQRA